MLHALGILMTLSMIVAVTAFDDGPAKIIKYVNENDGTGNYYFSFETSNGLSREETGTLVNRGEKDERVEVNGYYKFLDDDGVPHIIQYKADQDGFQIISEDGKEVSRSGPEIVLQVMSGLSGPAEGKLLRR